MHNPDCDVMDINPEGIRKPCNCGQAIPGWVGKDPLCSRCRRTATWAWAQEGKIAFAACDQHRKDVMHTRLSMEAEGRERTDTPRKTP